MDNTDQIILDKVNQLTEKMSLVEEALKMLLINDVLNDADTFSEKTISISNPTNTLQQENDNLKQKQKKLESENSKLRSQLESYQARIKTLQELSDSKERTLKAKEEYIQLLQGKSNKSTYSSQSIQPVSTPVSYAKTTVKTYFAGEKVRIKSNCSYCYHSDEKRSKKQIPLTNPSSYICTIIERDSKASKEQYLLYTKNAYGQEIRFWVDGDMIQSL